MLRKRFTGFVGVAVAGSLLFSTTSAVAATSTYSSQQFNPWAALAMMSGAAPAAALCGGATPVDPNAPPPAGVVPGCILPVTDVTPGFQANGPPPPIPVPPVEPGGAGLGFDPLYLGLGVLLLGGLLWLLLHKKHGNSPA